MGSLGSGYAWVAITLGVSERWYQGTGQSPPWNPNLCDYNVIPNCSTSCGGDTCEADRGEGDCQTDFYLLYIYWFTFSDDASGTRYCLIGVPKRHQSSPGICYDTW
jgi:hypothetical protein